ncbi:MAG: AMP-binding protein, partial [Candidatus Omnitrophica bacterium]|nr:AMP-binding protein [Candidatus Omnitrophota bacterium]
FNRVIIILENCPEWIFIYLGILKAGLTAVPLDPQLSVQEIKNILNDCQAEIIFTSAKIFSKTDRIFNLTNKKIIIIDSNQFLDILKRPLPDNLPSVKADNLASIIYTSGTVAKPKGVALTHKNFLSDFESISSLGLITSNDNFIALLPFYHAYAFMVTLLSPLFLGAKITITQSLKSEEIIQTLKETEVTIFTVVPQILNQIHKSIIDGINKKTFILRLFIKTSIDCLWLMRKYLKLNLAKFFLGKIHQKFGYRLRFIVSGGARLAPRICGDLLKFGFTVLEGYGLTEASPVVSINLPDKIKPGSVGMALPKIEIKIVDVKDYKINLTPYKIGEVAIRGHNVMQGYFNQPELTQEVIKDGWLLTGDLGYLDKDGALFLTGRKKEILVLASGKNIDPEELETYYASSPYIKELCIIEKDGLLEAVILPDFDYFKQKKEINIRAKIHWVLENLSVKLPSYKRIMGFVLTKSPLARTHLGKLKRYQIKEDYLRLCQTQIKEGPSIYAEQDLSLLNQEQVKLIMRFLNKELKRPVYLDDHLELDLGIDSIARLDLTLGLEKLLNISLKEEDVAKVSTVRELIFLVNRIFKEKKGPLALKDTATWGETLNQAPLPEIVKKIHLKPDIFDFILNVIAKIIFYFLFRTVWRLRIKGKENLPAKVPYIICPNHASYLDSLFIFTALPLKTILNLYFIGYAALFKYWISSWLIKPGRIIALEPTADIGLSLQISAFLLNKGKALCIFPEGGRSIDENINEFKKGVGILSYELKIPLIPVYIKGSHFSWPRGKILPRPYPIQIIVGKPQKPEELLYRGRQKGITDNYAAISSALRDEVIKLTQS